MKRIPTLITVSAIAVSAVVALAACSGGNDSASTSAGGGSIKVMVFGSFSQPPFPLAQIKTGATAAVKRVNDAGGINGKKIDLISCDDNSSANGATACGRQAVQEGVAAVVGSFTLFGDNIVPLLESAKIPYVLPVAISHLETTSTISFPIMSASAPAAADLLALKKQGCSTIVFASSQNAQSQDTFAKNTKPLAAQVGVKVAAVLYPPSTTDYTGVAAQIVDAGDCVVYGGGAAETAAIIPAIKQTGKQITQVVLSTIGLPEVTLAQLGKSGDGVKVYSPIYYPSTKKAAVVQAVTDMKAVDSKVTIDEVGLNAYASVLAFTDVAKKLGGDVTGEAVIKKLNTAGTVIDTGMFAPTDFSKNANFLPTVPRVAGSVYQPYTAKDGVYVAEGDGIDLLGNLGF
ncbi:hypothetical protein BH11ACT2_BH11ACT2_22320 [soil metagenome]